MTFQECFKLFLYGMGGGAILVSAVTIIGYSIDILFKTAKGG